MAGGASEAKLGQDQSNSDKTVTRRAAKMDQKQTNANRKVIRRATEAKMHKNEQSQVQE